MFLSLLPRLAEFRGFPKFDFKTNIPRRSELKKKTNLLDEKFDELKLIESELIVPDDELGAAVTTRDP